MRTRRSAGNTRVSLYAYTHVAHEGGFDLAPYPAIRAWCERIEKQPEWAPITER
jgi:glutathione S-transferase